jgi:hypothetical protein
VLNDETLEERLRRDLGRLQPGPAPVDALIGRGRVIKARRRAGVATGLAAVAALAIGAPVVLGGGGPSATSGAAKRQIVLASGTVGGKTWSFVTEEPAPKGCPGYVSGRWGTTSVDACLGIIPAATTDPASVGSGGGLSTINLFIARLRPDVDHVTVTGTDGGVQTPAVATIFGSRYALFALPPKQGIARIDAIGTAGKLLAYAIPFNGPDNARPGVIQFWYPAGSTPTQAAVKQIIFSGTMPPASTPVTATVEMGPFGVCLLVSVPQGLEEGTNLGPDCHSLTPPDATSLTSLRSYPIGVRKLFLGEVNNAVDHVDVTLSDASTTRLTPIRIGGHSFVVIFVAAGLDYGVVKAYDAAGKQLAALS